MITQLTKYFCHFTKGAYTTPYWLEVTWRKKLLDLTWTIMWLDLTWLEKNSNELTWLATRVLLTWLDLWLEQRWLVTTLDMRCYKLTKSSCSISPSCVSSPFDSSAAAALSCSTILSCFLISNSNKLDKNDNNRKKCKQRVKGQQSWNDTDYSVHISLLANKKEDRHDLIKPWKITIPEKTMERRNNYTLSLLCPKIFKHLVKFYLPVLPSKKLTPSMYNRS